MGHSSAFQQDGTSSGIPSSPAPAPLPSSGAPVPGLTCAPSGSRQQHVPCGAVSPERPPAWGRGIAPRSCGTASVTGGTWKCCHPPRAMPAVLVIPSGQDGRRTRHFTSPVPGDSRAQISLFAGGVAARRTPRECPQGQDGASETDESQPCSQRGCSVLSSLWLEHQPKAKVQLSASIQIRVLNFHISSPGCPGCLPFPVTS